MNPNTVADRQTDPTEQRWGQRVPLSIPVDIDSGRIFAHGVMRSASISGAVIDTPLGLPVFSHLVVRWQVPGAPAATTQGVAACVVRRTEHGFAVEWRDMECEALLALLHSTGADDAQLRARDCVFS